jgi:S-formylglutathione hydrolase FrmB
VRRSLLVALAVLALTAIGVAAFLRASDDLAGTGVEKRSFDRRSAAVGRTLHHKVLLPEGGDDGAPLLVLLHGRGKNGPERMITAELGQALEAAGSRAPVVLLPDGGESSYWHDRRDGAWGRMVVEELIPAAARRFGADPKRVAIGGISMGGFGALHLAAANPERFCAVGAHSPAVFPEAGATAPGAFDDAEDFARTDLLARAGSIPAGAWVDIGDEDPFASTVRELVKRMREPRWHPWKGKHESAYWNAHTKQWMQFYVRSLADC